MRVSGPTPPVAYPVYQALSLIQTVNIMDMNFQPGAIAEYESLPDPGLSPIKAITGAGAAPYPIKPDPNHKPTPVAKVSEAPDPRCGTWLDEDLRLSGLEGEELLRRVLAFLYDSGRKIESGRRDHKANFEKRVECFLVNAFRAHFYRETGRVAYMRGNNDYRNKERWESGSSMRDTVDVMAAAGFLATEKGAWAGPIPGFGKGWSATFWLLPPLLEMGADCGVSHLTISKPPIPKSKLIRLRGAKDAEGKAPELNVVPTEETERWAADLDRYNRFADGHEIDIHLSRKGEVQLKEAYNRKQGEYSRQPGIIRPEFFDRHLVRIFNDGDTRPGFEHGGRMYGAWYQRVPKWLRHRVTINDNETVELDYSGMAVRMIYHLRGQPYLDDPYALIGPETYAVKKGRPKDYYRESIKKLVQAMLNNEDDDKDPEMVRLETSFGPRFTRAQIRDMILVKHGEMKDAFGTGIGKRLQRIDSDIALKVIVNLMDDGILCLPIHDGFRVEKAKKDKLMHHMREAYLEMLGYYSVINTK